jgi:hypothetical protein
VQGNLKTGAQMTVEPLSNPVCCTPLIPPAGYTACPPVWLAAAYSGADGLRSWLNKKWTTARPATARRIGDKGTRSDPPHLHS